MALKAPQCQSRHQCVFVCCIHILSSWQSLFVEFVTFRRLFWFDSYERIGSLHIHIYTHRSKVHDITFNCDSSPLRNSGNIQAHLWKCYFSINTRLCFCVNYFVAGRLTSYRCAKSVEHLTILSMMKRRRFLLLVEYLFCLAMSNGRRWRFIFQKNLFSIGYTVQGGEDS